MIEVELKNFEIRNTTLAKGDALNVSVFAEYQDDKRNFLRTVVGYVVIEVTGPNSIKVAFNGQALGVFSQLSYPEKSQEPETKGPARLIEMDAV